MANVYGNNGNNLLDAADGVTNSADAVYGYDGNDTIFGLNGDDLLFGGDGNDTLDGGDGNDTLKGGGGADTLNGWDGLFDTASYIDSPAGVFVSLIDDHAEGGDAEGDELNYIDCLTGSNHDDDLWGDDWHNVLNGGDGEDTLKGYGGSDVLNGGNDDDNLYGMDGVDRLKGGNGSDYLYGGANQDHLDGGNGNDTMVGGTGNDEYFVGSAGDVVTELAGQGTNDVIYANVANFTLADSVHVEIVSLAGSLVGVNATGNNKSNTIYGNANDNTLNGGAGSDALSGLGGNDTFVFVAGQAHGDVIYEFQGNGAHAGDVIRLEGYGKGAAFHQLSATHWQVSSADGSITETIVFDGAYTFDTTTDLIFA